ncbi:hypothetical protein Daesc_010035 [Daldinia eschscholtzii]|uniref:Uncharacterized protein n=1 Tax=Daldinia eschscholtzii TaxID=292717 RepID=A0AAX6M7U3_9PEZI
MAWSCKAYKAGNDWSVDILNTFNVIHNIPGGADQVAFLITPKDYNTFIFMWSEENGQGLRTTMSFDADAGTKYGGRRTVEEFKSWQISINTQHA